MIRSIWVLMTFLGVTLSLMGCGQTETVTIEKEETIPIETADSGQEEEITIESEPSTPLQWIYFQDEKYEFNRVVPVQEIDQAKLAPTGTVTGKDDGFLPGQEIFLYEIDGSIFVVDDTGPTEEWANFTK